MPVTLKCPDCGHAVQAADDTPRTCPQCDGTMTKPAYKAKAKSLDAEAEEKAKARARDADDEDEKPKKKRPRTEDEDDAPRKSKPRKAASFDGEKGEGSTRDPKAAESLDIDPGFTNKPLMKQVEAELSRGEVLHWAARPCLKIAQREGRKAALLGIFFAVLGAIFSAVFFVVAPWFVGLIPLLFVAIGVAIAIFGPRLKIKQAERGWYAITDRRAIVFTASAWGDSGQVTSYEPDELKRMRVQNSTVVKGGGDLIFRTETHTQLHTTHTARGGSRTEERTSVHHYGFLGIEDVREVETLVHNVLLGRNRDDDD